MPEQASSHPVIPPAKGDSIRIVPVHPVEELASVAHGAPATPPPQLTYRGGPLLSAVEVFTVFWGTAWTSPPESDYVNSLNQFFDFVLTSALLDQLAEYNVPASAIGHGKRTGTATITTPALGASITDAAIQHALQQEISTNSAFPPPTPNTLYFLYLPAGVTVTQGGSRSCQAFCGYHNDIGGSIFYAVMPFPGCAGCTGGLAPLDALTSTSSHELCEAITDPVPGQGWYDDANGEIGDICAWKTKTLGDYTVQLEWSNQANACV
ncbi:MAG TPA: hypothetical protein VG388_02965 [Solirubrobacteraceae bacterium]|jgi:hypothetical protein|nr:hypothetical protein [Solirubrobacteraceae bacterium]